MRGTLLLLLTVWLALGGCGVSQRADGPLNVVLISVDDMRAWAGCMGESPVTPSVTPNIDRLAERGVLFTRAYAAAPLCNPSRTAVFTGLRPSTTGVYNNDQWWRPATEGVATMPEHFRAAGYRVIGAGKVYHHMPGFNPPGQWDRYFTQVFDDPYHRPTGTRIDPVVGVHWPEGFPLNGLGHLTNHRPWPFNARELDWGPLPRSDAEMGDGQMAAWVAQQLGAVKPGDGPLFVAAGTFKPHLPWYAPRKYFDRIDPATITLPELKDDDLADVPPMGVKFAHATEEYEVVKQAGARREAVRAYLAAISFADACVGTIVHAVESNPALAGNTVIVLWSDHGWHHGEKDHWLKSTLWEEATHVPLIIVAPGVRPGRSGRTVGLIDIYPTLVDVTGIAPPRQRLDGTSLVPLMRDPGSRWDRPALTTYLRGNHAVRDERWRYIRYADGTEELYDHANDPREWTNLAARPEHAAVKRRLAAFMPADNAPDAPPKSAYQFDFDSYTWKRKP